MAKTFRIGGIDFWRGLVLLAILVDHIPGNLLENWTPRNFGLSDSAEAFVFLSGLSVGIAYFPKFGEAGLAPVAKGCARRAFKLYQVHLAITLLGLLIFAAGYALGGVEELIQAHGRAFVFQQPASGALGLALLSHQIGYFNILPLYVALMLWSPMALWMASRRPALALLTSVCVYAASRVLGLHLPNWPEPGGWFFNPFAWQLIFTLGVVAAVAWRERPPARSPILLALSAAVLIGGAVVVTDGAHVWPGLRDLAFLHLDLGKQDLGLVRLAHFFALAYVVATAPRLGAIVDSAPGRALQRLGRHSLAIFAAGSLLSAVGQAGLATAGRLTSVDVQTGLGIAYTLASVAVLVGLANHFEGRSHPAGARPSRGSFWRRLSYRERLAPVS